METKTKRKETIFPISETNRKIEESFGNIQMSHLL